MGRNRLQSKALALIFSLLIIFSGFSVLIPSFETVSAEEVRGEEPTRGEGTTWYVDDDASGGGDGSLERPYQKIQDAIDNALEGDSVRVFNGTYFENVYVNISLSLVGNGSTNTIVDGGEVNDVIWIRADHVNISGFRVLNADDYWQVKGAAIRITSSYNRIDHCNVSDGSYGIYLSESCGNNTIENNEITRGRSNMDAAIFLFEAFDNLIANNTCILDSGGDSISLDSSDRNIIDNNTCQSRWSRGIEIDSSSWNIISNNTCSDSENSGIRILDKSKWNIVSENNCSGNKYTGIHIGSYRESSNHVERNRVMNNGRHGIFLSNTDDCIVRENYLEGNGVSSIAIDRSYSALLHNNTMHGPGISVEYPAYYFWTNQIISTNNTVNGKPVRYYANENNFQVPQGAAQVILANCSNVTITDQDLENVHDGIVLTLVENISIHNSESTGNVNAGILLAQTENVTISGCNLSDNTYGIHMMYYSNNGKMMENSIWNNEDAGIYARFSDDNIVRNNTFSHNRNGIVLVDESKRMLANNNSIYANVDHGIKADENDDLVVNATNNFWGAITGPYHETLNPDGTGDNISGDVEFDPWTGKSELIHYVSKSGDDSRGNGSRENPFLTIQKAVDESQNGHTIQVQPGVYEENVVVNMSVEIIGNGSSATMIRGVGGGKGDEEEYQINCSFEGGYGGGYYGIDYEGDYCYAAHILGLSIFDVSDPSDPKEVGFIRTQGQARSVAVSQGYAYVADFGFGLSIIDISDPGNPTEAGHYETSPYASTVAVSGGYAYVTDYYGFVIVDIRDPMNPVVVGNYETSDSAQGIAVNGGYAYVANSENGLVIVDISDMESPAEAGHYDTAGDAWSVTVSGEYAYVADSDNGLVIVDISDPGNPTEVGDYDAAGDAWNVAVSGGYAYVAFGTNGLLIVDISDPESPVREGHYKSIDSAWGVAVNGGYAYVTDYYNGPIIIDISDPGNPTKAGGYISTSSTNSVAVRGDYAYVVDRYNGLLILNISDPDSPTRTGHFDTPGDSWDIAVSGGYAYIADGSRGLLIVDISDPGNPMEAGQYNTAGTAYGIAVSEGYAYIADYDNGLLIVNISDPGNPTEAAHYDQPGDASDVTVSGGYAYLAYNSMGLVILDISDPENPRGGDQYNTAGYVSGVAVNGEYAYVADHSNGLIILDISDPKNPEEAGHFTTDGDALDVAVRGEYAYVIDNYNGLIVVDISDPQNPSVGGHYNTNGNARDISLFGDHAYIADTYNGLVIIKLDIFPDATVHITVEDVHISDLTICNSSRGGVLIDADNANIFRCLITGNEDGVRIINGIGNVSIHYNDIYENNVYGINASGNIGIAVSSTQNWWGDKSGPYHPGHNPAGKGDNVTDFVEFDPWVRQEFFEDTLYVAKYGNDATGNGTIENPFLTIQKAIDESQDWDTIRVFAGVYEENVVVGKNLEIIGNGSVETVIVGLGMENREEVCFEVGHYDTYRAQGLVVSGGYAYVADSENGLVIVDIGDPTGPTQVGHYDTAGDAYSVAVSGGYAYIADWDNGLVIVDISDPMDPTEEGRCNITGAAVGVAVSGEYAFVAAFTNGLVIVNISDPTNPKEEGRYDTGGYAVGVAVSDDYAYVGSGDLVIVDISDPTDPIEEGRYDTAEWAYGVSVSGGYVYVADGDNGLVIVDISDPTDPMEEGHYDTAGQAYEVSVCGGYAYVADYDNGLVIVDISDPTNPKEEGHYDTAGQAYDVSVNGGYAYVADYENGLVIVDTVFPTSTLTITASCTLSHLAITNSSIAGVLIDADHVRINSCDIHDNIIGIKIVNGSGMANVQYCNIFDNTLLGIDTSENSGFSVVATNNWWGHPSGPYHPSLNPEGNGNPVSDYVIFNPWLTRPKDYMKHHVTPGGNDTTGTGDEGNPYKSIQKAINMAQEWDTILVALGTYSESITIDKRNVTIIGDSADTTIIDAGGAETTCTITADSVELNGFTIRNGMENGILIINSSGNRIVNCIFPDNSYDLNLTNSKGNQIINTTFESVNISDSLSDISILWPLDLKVTNNRSGFIPNAHLKISDDFGTTVFDGFADENGQITQLPLLDYEQNQSVTIDYNPYLIEVWKEGYLNFQAELTIVSHTRAMFQMETHDLPIAIISGDMVRHVSMDSFILLDGSESTGRSIDYLWEFGDSTTSFSSKPSHIYTAPGAYEVNLTVTDDYNNESSTSIVVIVENVIPIVRADSDRQSVFEDEAIQFVAYDSWDTDSDVLYFYWNFDDGTNSSDDYPAHIYHDAGEYTVSLTAMDMFGGKSTETLNVTVSNMEPWIGETNVTGMHYPGKPLQFSVTAYDSLSDVPSLKYTWDFGDGTISQGQNITHIFREAGKFYATVTVTDDNGDSDFESMRVVIADPEITSFVSSSSIFQDETVFFDASHELDDGSFVYTWYFGDGTTVDWNETSHTYEKLGIFTPYLIIDNGIENVTLFMKEIVVINVIPTAQIVAEKHQIREDESLLFDASNSVDSTSDIEHLSYFWDFGDGSKGSGMDVTHAFAEDGNYTVVLTVSDGKDTNTTQVEIEIDNVLPTANAGISKEREVTVGMPVILDASQSLDTESDIQELNYTWKIDDDTIYGEIVSYTFETAGSFPVILKVHDNNGAVSEDTLTFEVSKSSVSEEEETMNTISWILVVIIIVFLVVIGYMVHTIKDNELIREYIAEKEAEEAIVIEGVIDKESYKPHGDAQEAAVEVGEEQDAEIVEAEVEVVREGETTDEMFKPPDDAQETTVEVTDDKMVAGQVEEEEKRKNEDVGNDTDSTTNGIENGER